MPIDQPFQVHANGDIGEPDRPKRTARFNFALLAATGMGLGWFPFMPGTVGAIPGVALAWGVGQLPRLWMQIAVIAAVCAVGVPLCTYVVRGLGGVKDPGYIVFDEIASLPITFFLVPIDHVWVVVAGFALHRLFDITKPPPARQLEGLREGLGIMADDWAAGVYSCLALHALRWLVAQGGAA